MFEPEFTISNKILKDIGVIEACREVIERAPLVPAYEADFVREAMVRMVHFGTAIEGNELSREQAERVVAVQAPGDDAARVAQKAEVVARERDVQEVINYRRVVDYIQGQQKKKKARYSKEQLKQVHRLTAERILQSGQVGDYRKTQVVIRNAKTKEISYRPPPAVEIRYQLDDFFAWLNSVSGREVHPVLRAGITHYELVRIHPFVDGNGRVARAMATLVLFMEGYDVKRFFSIEEYYDKHSKAYYEALQSVMEQRGDLTKWLEFFTAGLAVELSRMKERVKKLSRE
jgi:Fic family protein